MITKYLLFDPIFKRVKLSYFFQYLSLVYVYTLILRENIFGQKHGFCRHRVHKIESKNDTLLQKWIKI